MKTIRKITVLILISAFLLALSGCKEGHTHHFSEWEYDTDSHWQVCACGEKDVSSSHTWDTEGICTICKGSYFDGAFETATTEEVQAFSDKLPDEGKAFDWKSGYMSFSKTETDGFDKRDGKVMNFREESVTNMYASAEEGSLIAELSLTETRTGEAGEIDKLIRGKSWYADGCIYVQEETEMSNSEKYRQEADFDFFLRYGKMSWQFADMTMIMQLLKGGFYDQVILHHCSEGVYNKFRIEIPAQTKDGVTNEMAFRFVFGEGNKLLGVKIETTMEFEYGDSIPDGASGAYKTVARGSVLPYGGNVIKPEDLESFPEKQTGTGTI